MFKHDEKFFIQVVSELLGFFDEHKIEITQTGEEIVLEKLFSQAVGFCPKTGKQAYYARLVMTFHETFFRVKTVYPFYDKK